MMKLIKKSEKLLLEKMQTIEDEVELNLPTDDLDLEPQSWNEDKVVLNAETPEQNYVPWRDNPMVQSAGNTGWQISEIWKEIRLDGF